LVWNSKCIQVALSANSHIVWREVCTEIIGVVGTCSFEVQRLSNMLDVLRSVIPGYIILIFDYPGLSGS
jgi:hypothetical protein